MSYNIISIVQYFKNGQRLQHIKCPYWDMLLCRSQAGTVAPSIFQQMALGYQLGAGLHYIILDLNYFLPVFRVAETHSVCRSSIRE